MFRRNIVVVVTAVLLCSMLAESARARLVVLSPETMIKTSDALASAVVLERRAEDECLVVLLGIERVHGGEVDADQIWVTVGPFRPGYGPPDAFPDEGTMVFVLLAKDADEWRLKADLNSVALIESGTISALHKGSHIGANNESWTADDYLAAYRDFFGQCQAYWADDTPRESAEQRSSLVILRLLELFQTR